MCLESAYYDTCIFLESQNNAHPESEACDRLLDVPRISWTVSLCPELSTGESTAKEYIQQFEIGCASHGVELIRIAPAAYAATSKRHLNLKKVLVRQGFSPRDWKHLMAAATADAKILLTVDPDFWDPRNKAQPTARRRLVEVKRAIESCLPLKILLPSEAIDACCR